MSCKKNKQKEVGIGIFFNKSLFKTFTYVSRPAKHQRAFKLKNKQIKNWAAFVVLLGNDEGKIINFYHQNFYLSNRMISFLKNSPSQSFFVHFLSFKQTLQFLQQICVKNVHPVYGHGIRTHNLQNMSLFP